MKTKPGILWVALVTTAVLHVPAGAADNVEKIVEGSWCGNPGILWGKDAGIVPGPSSDRVEKIVSRYSLAIGDTFDKVAHKNTWGTKYPVGFLLGNGDATVSLKDEKGRWTFTVSPLDYWWGLPQDKRYGTEKYGTMTHGVAGRVAIAIPELANCSGYKLLQDIYRAELRGEFTNEAFAVQMTSHVLRGSRNLATRISNVGKAPVTLLVEVNTGAPYNTFSTSAAGAKDGMIYVSRNGQATNTPSVVCYASLGAKVIGPDYSVSADKSKFVAKTSSMIVKPGENVTVLAGYDTSVTFPDDYTMPKVKAYIRNQTSDAVTPMLAGLKSLTASDVDAMIEKHRGWWRDFWNRSYIDVPDEPAIGAHWYGKLFLAGQQVTPGRFPPGLLGWVDKDKGVYAGDDLHLNWNLQFFFKGFCLANHPEMVKCYSDMMIAAQPMFEELAARRKEPGIHVGTGMAPYGWTYDNDMGMVHNNADVAHPMIIYYKYTLDDEFLRNDLYPFLKKVAENLEHVVKWETTGNKIWDKPFDFKGRYVVTTCVAECIGKHRINPPSAIAMVSRVYQTLILGSSVLGVDADLRSGWEDRLNKMSPMPLVDVDGLTCMSLSEDNPTVKKTGYYEPYTLLPFAPHEYLDADSPLAPYARNLIDVTQALSPSNGFWGWHVGQAARCGYPVGPILNRIRNVAANIQPNYTTRNDGSVNDLQMLDGIGYLFLQTIGGRIVVFPSWDMKINAAFNQLRTEGAFLVSARLAGGVIGPVTVLSEKGLPCRIQKPWPGKAIKVETEGVAVAIRPATPPKNAKGPHGNPPEIFEFETAPGKTYRIVPET